MFCREGIVRSLIWLTFFRGMSDALLRDQNRLKNAVKYFSPNANIEAAVSQLDHLFKSASGNYSKEKDGARKAVNRPWCHRAHSRANRKCVANLSSRHSYFSELSSPARPNSWPEGLREISVNKLPKGMFTSPAMQWNWLDLDEKIVRAICDGTANLIWNEFWRRPRSIAKAPHRFEPEVLERQLRHLAKQVGPRPSLCFQTLIRPKGF